MLLELLLTPLFHQHLTLLHLELFPLIRLYIFVFLQLYIHLQKEGYPNEDHGKHLENIFLFQFLLSSRRRNDGDMIKLIGGERLPPVSLAIIRLCAELGLDKRYSVARAKFVIPRYTVGRFNIPQRHCGVFIHAMVFGPKRIVTFL